MPTFAWFPKWASSLVIVLRPGVHDRSWSLQFPQLRPLYGCNEWVENGRRRRSWARDWSVRRMKCWREGTVRMASRCWSESNTSGVLMVIVSFGFLYSFLRTFDSFCFCYPLMITFLSDLVEEMIPPICLHANCFLVFRAFRAGWMKDLSIWILHIVASLGWHSVWKWECPWVHVTFSQPYSASNQQG